jgi:transcription elongation factor Elf1
MMTRSTTSSVTGRASAMRRMRRRSHAGTPANGLFCGTNGCASLLDLDGETGKATCHICGFVRRVN